MGIRGLLNFPSKLQQSLIATDIQNVLSKCDVIATAEFVEQKEAQESHDNVCPKCHARKDRIVNKIRNVQGSGKVTGVFHLGYGNIDGIMSVTTGEVNHCNVCGNEWKKYKVIYVSKTEISRVALKYLAAIINNPEEKQYGFKVETIKVFDGCYVETILQLVKENKSNLLSSTQNTLKRRNLKKYFKSVYGGTVKLQKL